MNIAMVCDFFYPQPGGIELHIYQIAQQLVDRGHSVVVITHSYGARSGVRTLTNGLKCYYVPFLTIYRESTFPTVFSFFPVFRNIMIREQIQVVHGHASMSSFCHEAIIHGRTMGLATVFTDHSLFGFTDPGAILVNKLLKFTMTDVDHAICVSHTGRENTVLRTALPPDKISVIPNAVISSEFTPREEGTGGGGAATSGASGAQEATPALEKGTTSTSPSSTINIIICARLYVNKGADLLVALIPRICAAKPNVNFIIAGSGPRQVDIQQALERHRIQDRVQLLGAVRHEQVRDLMVQGQIFLHPSLTEAFGTVLLEAASCGLLVVTTRVGGIPEVLPSDMTIYADPVASSLTASTLEAIALIEANKVDTSTFHDRIKKMYCWTDIAIRTEAVYEQILANPQDDDLMGRLQRHNQCGPFSGKLFVLCIVVDVLLYYVLEFFSPRSRIDLARKWPGRGRAKEAKG